MTSFLRKHHRLLFYSTWFLLALFQSIFTELLDDEAYYWVFSKYLDWGYFDHPPMIALLVKMGTAVFDGELGVRLLPLFLNTATIYLTEKLTNQKEPFVFYAIALSVAVLQISGFVAVPDIPLLFFTALFLLLYRNFLENDSWKNVLWLSLAAAALLYSKYHGVLVLLFVVLSNPKLLRNPKVYAAGVLALLLYLPHLWWQYQHDWISFRYHLFESNVNPYRFSYTTDYILGQLLIAGPIAGFFLWPAAFLYRTQNSFERALKFTALGFFFFFLISTFKGKVEANWTAPAIIPLIVLAHQYLLQKQEWQKWLIRLLPVTVLITIACRVIMIVDLIPAEAIVERFHAWKGWPQELKQKTKNLPIVFRNSYQMASKYWFYTGQMTYSLNNFDDRRNNYNYWPIEDSLLGKPVYIMDTYGLEWFTDSVTAPLYHVGYRYDSSLYSFAKIQFKNNDYQLRAGDSLPLRFIVDVPAHYQQFLESHPAVDENVALVFFKDRDKVSIINAPFTLRQAMQQNFLSKPIPLRLPKGEYNFRYGVMSSSGVYTHNSEKIKLKID